MKITPTILGLLLTVAPIFSPASAADQAAFLPPYDMVQQAINGHPMVSAASARMTAAEADARGRRAGHDYTFSGSYMRRDTPDGNYGELDGTLSRAIRLPGKAKADRKIGALGVDVAENARDDARHQVALLLKDHWMTWLAASAVAKVDQEALGTYERELKAVKERKRLKDAAELDVEMVETALMQAKASARASKAKALEARRALRRIFPGLALPATAPALPDPVETGHTRQEWHELILSRSHELKMAEQEAQRQLALAHRAKLDKMPDPSVGVRLFRERGGAETGVGVVFSMPFGMTRRSAQSDYQRAQAVAAAAEAQQARRDLEVLAERDITRAQTGLGVWQDAQSAEESGIAVTKRLARAVELGERDLTDYLRALRQQYELKRSEVMARAEAQNATLQLKIDSHEIWVRHTEGEHDHHE